MTTTVPELVENYWSWLKAKTTFNQLGEWVEITTPYLDRHNDYFQVYARVADGDILLSDDGYVLDDLRSSGCDLDSPRRRKLLDTTLNGFGVRQERGALQVTATAHNFPQRKHNLLQAMIAVNDMFVLASPTVESLFVEDVAEWFDAVDIAYVSMVRFTGKSGFDHHFDFALPRLRNQPERLVDTINRPRREEAIVTAFKWFDIHDTRPAGAQAMAILNDSEHAVSPAVLEALDSYDVRPILWSQRDQVRGELAIA